MNQETMLYLYHKMSGMFEERRNGRTIVLLGDSESYRTFLKEKYGQEEVMLLTTIKKKASDKVVYIGDIVYSLSTALICIYQRIRVIRILSIPPQTVRNHIIFCI